MSNIAIKAEHISKAYQLGQIGTGTISRDLERWYATLRGKEDPYLKVGESNDRRKKGSNDVVWSLKDISFEINQGDAVGIIGKNGAGKSTLLKILSKVTSPTRGKITGRGRIASLLEVGTGFHPELSGKENIFLNGAILGMRKREIERKLEEIVDFAGVERYLDTPVKRYSSGMYVRLAFAVAAHLESEILIVDEVLAVGDAEFQKKCLGKMGEVSKGEGRTVLFVSHNMAAIKTLCNRGILLANGESILNSDISNCVNLYNKHQPISQIALNFNGPLQQFVAIFEVKVNGRSESAVNILPDEDTIIEISYLVKEELRDVIIFFALFNEGYRLTTRRNVSKEKPVVGQRYKAVFSIKMMTLRPAVYSLSVGAWANNETLWSWGPDICSFRIEEIWSEHLHMADEGIINMDIQTERLLL